ncbi:VOC family protein [Actinopolymorpha pittospori]|uniref:Catechol 2,3-dioxygenase-like lactoylglutathione lyase family enzyme n=1 Tax=Actinopolymorpha pittospori TaxID=648752 RepID=A0A927R9T3_9ACTN|nr:catechol 2,3-dioxygenase-like lactoylglutathione lyase family enzyme [Actinopolymorpha pittospori]
MSTVSVRYIVDDVDAAISFYTTQLGFDLDMHPAPTFAAVSSGDLRLLLSAPGGPGGGGAAMPDGRVPEPGGWNRILVVVEDLEATVKRLQAAGAVFRNEIVTGVGGNALNEPPPGGRARAPYSRTTTLCSGIGP